MICLLNIPVGVNAKNPNVLDLGIFFSRRKKNRNILLAQDIPWACEEHNKLTFAPFWSQYL
jgi:hypothetical protein